MLSPTPSHNWPHGIFREVAVALWGSGELHSTTAHIEPSICITLTLHHQVKTFMTENIDREEPANIAKLSKSFVQMTK